MSDVGSAGIGVAIGAFLTGAWNWLTQRSRSETATEVAVLEQWQRLFSSALERVSALEKECAELRMLHAKDIAEMRADHTKEIEEITEIHRAGMDAMRAENKALRDTIIQNSRSTAQMLSRSPVAHPKDAPDGK